MIHTAVMARNESGRYLWDALESWADFSDTIFFLDDYSEDDTLATAMEFDETIPVEMDENEPSESAWGNEAKYRKRLFDFATEVADVGDVILWLDCDMSPLNNPRQYLLNSDATIFLFRLFDFWSTDANTAGWQHTIGQFDYRDEPPYWVAHKNPRPWAIRVTKEVKNCQFGWNERGIHCGHLPEGLFGLDHLPELVPPEFSLGHWGWHHKKDREIKYERYMEVADQLSDFERKHLDTVLEPHPRVSKLEMEVEYPLRRADG